MMGTLYGLGVGPGDPELLTLKALRILKAAPVVAYPAPDTGESFARSIVAGYLEEGHAEVPIVIPMRSERFPARTIYDKAAGEIGRHLLAGRDVAALCEGDPFFYGSFMYLFERLADRFPVEIVPGVSSVVACAAALQRPLAARNDRLAVIPAPLDDDRVAAMLHASDAAAIIKVGRHLPRMHALLDRLGLLDGAGYIERVGLDSQKVMPLAQQPATAAPYFSMILVYKGAEDWISRQAIPVSAAAGDLAP